MYVCGSIALLGEVINISNLVVRELTNSEYSTWDSLVDESQNGTIFHSTDWLHLCSEYFGYPFIIVGCFNEGDLIGGCSLFVNNNRLWRSAFSTFEFTPYGGIVIGEAGSDSVRGMLLWRNEIISVINKFLELKKYRNIDLVCSPGLTDIRPLTWKGWRNEVRYAYYLENGAGVESFSKDVRSDIKKAKKMGVQVERRFDAKTHYDFYLKTFYRQNLRPPVNIEFFDKVLERLGKTNRAHMFIGKTSDDVPISSLIVLTDKKMSYLWSSYTDPHYVNHDSFLLLLLETMAGCNSKSYEYIDLMQANEYRLAMFAARFNPRLIPYYRVYKSDIIYQTANFFRSLIPRDR